MIKAEFERIKLDTFREITSIATSHAAKSLSTMLGSKVNITVPNVIVEKVENVPELLGGRDKSTVAVFFTISGHISGSILLVLSALESLRFTNLLTGQKLTKIEDLDEMGRSALKELGNVEAGSYVRVLADGLQMKVSYSVPGFTYDMLGAILDEMLACHSLETNYVVVMESEFVVMEQIYRGHLLFILSPKAVNAIINSLGNLQKPEPDSESMDPSGEEKKDELSEIFHLEVQNSIGQMKKDLSCLAQLKEPAGRDPDQKMPALDRLFRQAHMVKSSSASMGFDQLQKLTQSLEHIFKLVRDEQISLTPHLVSLLSESMDTCQGLLDQKEVGDYRELMERLDLTLCP